MHAGIIYPMRANGQRYTKFEVLAGTEPRRCLGHGAHFASHRQILAQMCLSEQARNYAKCVTNQILYTAMLGQVGTI